MLFYTVTGWIYFKEPSGNYVIMVKGVEATGTNCMILYAGSKEAPLQKNAAEKLIPDLRAKLPQLIVEYIYSGQWWSGDIMEEAYDYSEVIGKPIPRTTQYAKEQYAKRSQA